MSNYLRCVALLILFAGLGACSLLRNEFSDPQVSLVGLHPGPSDGLYQTVMVDLMITNPNHTALKLNAIQYRIRLEGRDLISGANREPLEVPAGGSEKYTVPATISLLSGFGFIKDMLTKPRDKISYELSATLEPTGLFSMPITVRKSDSIALAP
ncbi:MAG TPA: LEA type 2 family protein [Spongiibacteraceae bacterium]|nr:LEA type 2 family protein [Spongiibacteraceae bacterium]